MEKRSESLAPIAALVTSLLIAWAGWVSNTLVSLQKAVSVIQFHDFGKISQSKEPRAPALLSDMNFFEFIKKRNDP